MKLLFEIDKKNYDKNGKAFIRPSARAKSSVVTSLLYTFFESSIF